VSEVLQRTAQYCAKHHTAARMHRTLAAQQLVTHTHSCALWTAQVQCVQQFKDADSEAKRAVQHDAKMAAGLTALCTATADMLVTSEQHVNTCRSVQQRAVADQQLKQHLRSTGTPDLDYLWGIADMYKVCEQQ
jgi:hypothetical protein